MKFDHLKPYAQAYVVRGSGHKRREDNCERVMIMPPGPMPDHTTNSWYCRITTLQDRKGAPRPRPQGTVRMIKANRLRLSTTSFLEG